MVDVFKPEIVVCVSGGVEEKFENGHYSYMFIFDPCAAGCGNIALTGSNLCGIHCVDQSAEARRICSLIEGQNNIVNLNAAQLKFENVNFSGKHFSGSNLQNQFL